MTAVVNSTRERTIQRHEQEQDADDGECFGDEGERLFVDGGDRLKEADGEPDDHRDDEHRRGNGERLVDHGFVGVRWRIRGPRPVE